ncbi:hypothetical protein TUM4261_32760 [Shewanella sp. c952]|uniref:hypothetical protein n=1 Tax=Shewanella sp. c952 TaxID=2815913 RepID=UPI001BBB71C2|nr:hypothetical protein [Shewanella sp. c952]GIU15582.1 hypothetical protein TUM4261_32760 [Shewanella sp. c952]
MKLTNRRAVNKPVLAGLLTVEMDAQAEMLFALDRQSGERLAHVVRPSQGLIKLILPFRYTQSNELIIGIVDGDREFNASVLDGVKLELVDQNTADTAQP